MLSEKFGEELQEDKVNNDCGLGEDLVLSFEVRLRKKFCQFAGRFRKLKIFAFLIGLNFILDSTSFRR
jgi:hypothetical protein